MSQATTTRPTAHANSVNRVDVYVGIHKALRHFMTDTLHRVGRMDVADAADIARTMAQFGALMTTCMDHLHHENEFLHTAIEARQPRGAARTADDHVEHIAHIEALRADADALTRAPAEGRALLALRLYRHLALFVADNFQHMNIEETQNNATLWASYSDAELIALHGRLAASLSPAETMDVARWMIPASAPAERAAILADFRAHAPAEAFAAVLDVVRPHLDDSAWDKLTRGLGLAQVPGLVDVRRGQA